MMALETPKPKRSTSEEIHSDRFHVKTYEGIHNIKVVDINDRRFRLTKLRIGTVMLEDHIDRGYMLAPKDPSVTDSLSFILTMDIVSGITRTVPLTVPCGWETTFKPDEVLALGGLSLTIQSVEFAGEGREIACDVQIIGVIELDVATLNICRVCGNHIMPTCDSCKIWTHGSEYSESEPRGTCHQCCDRYLRCNRRSDVRWDLRGYRVD